MSLYQKYRPSRLSDVVGQRETVKQLRGFGSTPPHVLGFFGPPGTGKTTLARIMASVVGASAINVVECNMAQDNGIDSIREMQQSCQLRPLGGGTTVYILDEFHSATKAAFQGLLKLLEDTPKHVYFFVCTSQPEKIDKAIRTRITGFSLTELPITDIATTLQAVAAAEGKHATTADLTTIAAAASGSMRTALVLLEQAIAVDFDSQVVASFKPLGEDFDTKPDLRDLARALIFKAGSWESLYSIVNALKDDELESARWFVLAYAKTCMATTKTAPMAARCIIEMREPFFNSKKAGFLAVCWKLYAAAKL